MNKNLTAFQNGNKKNSDLTVNNLEARKITI